MENLATGEYTRAGAVAYTPRVRYFFNSEPPGPPHLSVLGGVYTPSVYTVFAVCEYHAFNSWLIPHQRFASYGACDICAAEGHRAREEHVGE